MFGSMKTLRSVLLGGSFLLAAGIGYAGPSQVGSTPPAATQAAAKTTVLHPEALAKLLPSTVYFKGQTAPTQTRNSGGIHFADNTYMLVALVDSSGYSTSIQEKYQAYLLTDVALLFDGHVLPPGAYGCGFRSGDVFVVMDIGGKDLLSAPTQKDAAMRRPTPLQVLAGESPDTFRLLEGRASITFSRAPEGSK